MLICIPVVFNAQEEFLLEADTTSVAIGERINLSLNIPTSVQDYQIAFPDTGNIITPQIEILERLKPDTLVNEFGESVVHTFVVTSFDSAYAVVPPFEVLSGGDTIKSNPLLLYFSYPDVDSKGDIKDVKTPVYLEITFWDKVQLHKAKIILGIILLLVLIFILYWFRRRKNQPKGSPIKKVEVKSPYQIAWERFIALQNKSLYSKGMIKDHYVELSNILRWYVEGQFGVNASEETTDEIIKNLRSNGIHRGDIGKLKRVLEQADMVKFAKAKPGVLYHEQVMKSARSFLQNTKTEVLKDE